MPDAPTLNRKYFIDLRDEALHEYLKDIKKAPEKRGWNAFMKQQIPSKRDVTANCQSYLKSLNDTCMALEHDQIWDDEDESDPGLKGSAAK